MTKHKNIINIQGFPGAGKSTLLEEIGRTGATPYSYSAILHNCFQKYLIDKKPDDVKTLDWCAMIDAACLTKDEPSEMLGGRSYRTAIITFRLSLPKDLILSLLANRIAHDWEDVVYTEIGTEEDFNRLVDFVKAEKPEAAITTLQVIITREGANSKLGDPRMIFTPKGSVQLANTGTPEDLLRGFVRITKQ